MVDSSSRDQPCAERGPYPVLTDGAYANLRAKLEAVQSIENGRLPWSMCEKPKNPLWTTATFHAEGVRLGDITSARPRDEIDIIGAYLVAAANAAPALLDRIEALEALRDGVGSAPRPPVIEGESLRG